VTGSPWFAQVREAFVAHLPGPVSVDEGYGQVTVEVPVEGWVKAVALARDQLGCAFFDWLSAVDDLEDGFRVVCHLAARRTGGVEHLVVQTVLDHESPVVASAAGVFAGARWHERETHEMFGVDFTEDGTTLALEGLLLPAGFEGHPLRKDFVLASRVAKAWPGAKEPGESDAAPRAPRSRRRSRPAGVPAPGEWGPQ
jgi:NADH:ubiquinone oxidoreductase subunit C